jgi:leucyl/phenylalanyl-tRNA--protein transferase
MTAHPAEPIPSRYAFDLEVAVAGEDLIGVGADLEPGTLLTGYRSGVFPMGMGRHGRGPLGWWSPDPRGVLPLDGLKVSRSLRRSCARYTVTVDTVFSQVVNACADSRRPGRWITPRFAEAYRRLYDLGWAHSVEVWLDDELAGGLYGVSVGGLFAGESMFHRERDASKVALVRLVTLLREDGDPRRVLDVQWRTDHLASLGVVEISRDDYRRRLALALEAGHAPAFAGTA